VRDEGFIGRSQAAHGYAENWEIVLGWLEFYLSAKVNSVFLAQTVDGRLLTMAGEHREDGSLSIFAARDMNPRERRRYRRQ